jgi:hypothetical protein
MKVALGTHEFSDDELKAIKKALGFRSGKATRRDVNDFASRAIRRAVLTARYPDLDERLDAFESEGLN